MFRIPLNVIVQGVFGYLFIKRKLHILDIIEHSKYSNMDIDFKFVFV